MAFENIAVTNLLIDTLSTRQCERILKHCTLVDLEFGAVLCEANQPSRFVYFPLTGFISSIAVESDVRPMETGLIGNEGMLGVSVAMGVNRALFKSVVQGSGTALRYPVEKFQQELLTSPPLAILLNRYIHVLMRQLAQSAICIQLHEIEARLARWLLMTNDRAHGDTFMLTHVFLAKMLGVRLSEVSIAADELREKSLISCARGNIEILDRKGLESISCSCYRWMLGHYSKLLPRDIASLVSGTHEIEEIRVY